MARVVSLAGCLLMTVALMFPRPAEACLWGQSATGELNGTRTSNSGIQATDGWGNGNFVLSWNISRDPGTGLWTYVYTADVVRKDISHFILEVSQDGDLFRTYPGTDTQVVGPQVWSSTTDGNSNPQMPNSIYGVKFDFGGTQATYTMVTDRAPVYGVFYAKDGKDGGVPVVAWSNALNYSDYKTLDSLTAADFIVRPDSATFVPIPAALPLFSSGLALLGVLRKRIEGTMRNYPE